MNYNYELVLQGLVLAQTQNKSAKENPWAKSFTKLGLPTHTCFKCGTGADYLQICSVSDSIIKKIRSFENYLIVELATFI